MSAPTNPSIQHIARQHLQTIRLLGVDFVPVNASVDQEPALPEASVSIQGAKSDSDEWRRRNRSALEKLQADHDAKCPHCTAMTYHTQTVFGEGNPCAQIMFIGEAPGEEEDRTGRPFVGRAGQKLDEIIKAMKLSRDDVYIANILKSRPPENRTPLPNEVDACAPFLAEQIRIVQPMVIVALGGPASKMLLGTETGITRLRGQWGWYVDNALRIPVMPTFHPAYVLRNYTVETRQKVWSDMQAVMQKLLEVPQ
jgi:uracil-DNA glycosylase